MRPGRAGSQPCRQGLHATEVPDASTPHGGCRAPGAVAQSGRTSGSGGTGVSCNVLPGTQEGPQLRSVLIPCPNRPRHSLGPQALELVGSGQQAPQGVGHLVVVPRIDHNAATELGDLKLTAEV